MMLEVMRCFHCGQAGHNTIQCPSKDKPRTQAGRDAYKQFFNTRKEGTRKNKEKGILFNYFKVKKQLRSKKLSSTLQVANDNKYIDPLGEIGPTLSNQKRSPPMVHAYRDFFDYFVGKVEEELKLLFQRHNDEDGVDYNVVVQPYRKRDQNQLPWQAALSEAVRNGEPADFSISSKNRIYALQKLETRTRYLHHLIMDWNIISNKVRKIIIDRINSDAEDEKELNIVSLGGGPGFDHVAFCSVLLFLSNMNDIDDNDGNSGFRMKLKTKVFDLFGEWEQVMLTMDQSLANSVQTIYDQFQVGGNIPKNDTTDDKINVDLFHPGGLSFHLCDIRERIHSNVNVELNDAMTDVDVVVFQFVMHENSSVLLSDSDNAHDGPPLLKGAARDILETARVGTIMICTDSHSFVWPSLKATAKIYGWDYFGAMERGSKISFGPKQFVLLERTRQ